MVFQKLNLKTVFNLLLISCFTLTHSSQPQKQLAPGELKITKNRLSEDPVTLEQQSAANNETKTTATESKTTEKETKKAAASRKIAEHLKSREGMKDEFDLVDEVSQTRQQVVETLLLESDDLGLCYQVVPLPDQNEEAVSRKGMFETLDAYLDRIIALGQFKAAHQNKQLYPRVGEDSGEALSTTVANLITLLAKQRVEKKQMCKTHRKDFTTLSGQLLKLVAANNQSYSKGSINQCRIESALKELKTAQITFEEFNETLLKEFDAQEERCSEISQQILDLHPTPATQPQIPVRRKLTFEQPETEKPTE